MLDKSGRPATAVVAAFIDEVHYRSGVKPICRVLTEHGVKIAPYHHPRAGETLSYDHEGHLATVTDGTATQSNTYDDRERDWCRSW